MKKVLVFLNILLVLMTLGSYLAPHISAEFSSLFPILGLGYPVLLLCNILMAALWIFIYPRYAMLSLVTLIIGYGSCSKLINFNTVDELNGKALVVATFNSNFLKPIAFTEESHRLEKEQALETYLNTLDVDVLGVQEHGWRTEKHFASAFPLMYKHTIDDATVAIYSKYPFAQVGQVDFDSNTANACLWADIVVGDDTIRVYTAHLESNRDSGEVPESIEQEAPESMSNFALLGIVKHFQKFSMIRATQAKMIQAHRKQCDYSSVICGDFNETPQSQVYKLALGDMHDTFVEGGRGLGSTFGERIPALRIDYIFADVSLEVVDYQTSKNAFSDHYLIKSTLDLRD